MRKMMETMLKRRRTRRRRKRKMEVSVLNCCRVKIRRPVLILIL